MNESTATPAAPTAVAATNIVDQVSAWNVRRSEIATQIERLIKRRDALLDAPLNEHDFYQFVKSYIRRRAADYKSSERPKNMRRYLSTYSRSGEPTNRLPASMRSVDYALNNNYAGIGLNAVLPVFFDSSNVFEAEAALCFFFGDVVTDKLTELFKSYGPLHPEGVISEADGTAEQRQDEIAAINAQLEPLEREMAELNSQIAQIDQMMRGIRDPGAAARTKQQQENLLDHKIYRDYDGKNEHEVAQRHGVSVQRVLRVGAMTSPPAI